MDIDQQLAGTFFHALTAGSTLIVVDTGHIVFNNNGVVGAGTLTQAAADTADGTVGLCNGTLIPVGTGDEDTLIIGHIHDDMPGTDLGTLHTVRAFLAIHLCHTAAVDTYRITL